MKLAEKVLVLRLSRKGELDKIAEFAPGNDRAWLVGAELTNDWVVTDPGVSSLHFYVEREGDALFLYPAQRRSEVRVNSALATHRTQLPELSLLEFGLARFRCEIVVADFLGAFGPAGTEVMLAPVVTEAAPRCTLAATKMGLVQIPVPPTVPEPRTS